MYIHVLQFLSVFLNLYSVPNLSIGMLYFTFIVSSFHKQQYHWLSLTFLPLSLSLSHCPFLLQSLICCLILLFFLSVSIYHSITFTLFISVSNYFLQTPIQVWSKGLCFLLPSSVFLTKTSFLQFLILYKYSYVRHFFHFQPQFLNFFTNVQSFQFQYCIHVHYNRQGFFSPCYFGPFTIANCFALSWICPDVVVLTKIFFGI